MQTSIAPNVRIRPLTIHDYQYLIERGTFGPEEHVELLNGQPIQMAAKGTRHSAAVSRITELLGRTIDRTALVRLQDAIELDGRSMPEPDLAIVKPHPLYYAERHPTPADIHWLIEVADTSLVYDTQTKAAAYGRSGIVDYWVIDLPNDRIWTFRNPNDTGYAHIEQCDRTAMIAPIPFPDCQFAVADLLGPVV